MNDPTNENEENSFTKFKKAERNLKIHSDEITKFYSEAAKRIKNQTNPPIAKPAYDKNDFEKDIPKAALLSEAEVDRHKCTIKADKKNNVDLIHIPDIDLKFYLN